MKEICFGKVVELKKKKTNKQTNKNKKKEVLQISFLENRTPSLLTLVVRLHSMHAATELLRHNYNFLFTIKYLY